MSKPILIAQISDLHIKAPGALGAAPYTLFGIISRRDARTLFPKAPEPAPAPASAVTAPPPAVPAPH